MGLTLGCARCHDHKFDPLPTRDYYSLLGRVHQHPDDAEPGHRGEGVRAAARPGAAAKRRLARTGPAEEADGETRELEAKFGKTPEADEGEAEGDPRRGRGRGRSQELDEPKLPPPEAVLAVEEGSRRRTAPGRGTCTSRSAATTRRRARRPRPSSRGSSPARVRRRSSPRRRTRPTSRSRTRRGSARPRGGSGRLELANWLDRPAAPAHRPRVRQPRLAAPLRRGARPHARTTSAGSATGRRTRSCSTGSPPGSWQDGWSREVAAPADALSSTYRMGRAVRHRGRGRRPGQPPAVRTYPRRRLEAEAIRDAMLAVAGTLDRTVGGSLLDDRQLRVRDQRPVHERRVGTTARAEHLPAGRPQQRVRVLPDVRLPRPERDERQAGRARSSPRRRCT